MVPSPAIHVSQPVHQDTPLHEKPLPPNFQANDRDSRRCPDWPFVAPASLPAFVQFAPKLAFQIRKLLDAKRLLLCEPQRSPRLSVIFSLCSSLRSSGAIFSVNSAHSVLRKNPQRHHKSVPSSPTHSSTLPVSHHFSTNAFNLPNTRSHCSDTCSK